MDQQNNHQDDGDGERAGGPPGAEEVVEKSPRGRYLRFKQLLGQGAYKQVWQAYDTIEGIEVAWNAVNLKKMPPAEKARVINEVRLLDCLEHNNIIDFHGSWVNREKGEVVFVTEILSSGSLKKFITKVQVIRWKIIKRWCKQILRALAYLHSQNPPIIHRDIKCDNIFINGTTGDLRIGDLGLSTTATIERNGKGQSVLGTPEFMAPELYDEEYDEMVDIYAFGMCAVEMITKQLPYAECTNPTQIYRKVTANIQPKALELVPEGPAHDFVLCCVAMDPKDRWSAQQLLEHPFLEPNPVLDETEVRIREPGMQQISENNAVVSDELGASSSRHHAPPPPSTSAKNQSGADNGAVSTNAKGSGSSSSSARQHQQQPTTASSSSSTQVPDQLVKSSGEESENAPAPQPAAPPAPPAEIVTRSPQPPQKQRRIRLKETMRLAVMAATESYVAASQAATGALDASARAMSNARKNGFEEEEEEDDDDDDEEDEIVPQQQQQHVDASPLKTPKSEVAGEAEACATNPDAPSTVFYTPKTARDSDMAPSDAPDVSSKTTDTPASDDRNHLNGVSPAAAAKHNAASNNVVVLVDRDARAEATSLPPSSGARRNSNGHAHEAARKPGTGGETDARQSDDRKTPLEESLASLDEDAEFEDAQSKRDNEEYFKNMGDAETLEKSNKVRVLEGREKRRADDDDDARPSRAPSPATTAAATTTAVVAPPPRPAPQQQPVEHAPRPRRPSQPSVVPENNVADKSAMNDGSQQQQHHAAPAPAKLVRTPSQSSRAGAEAPAPAVARSSTLPISGFSPAPAAPVPASPRRVPSPGIKANKSPSPPSNRKESAANVAGQVNNGQAFHEAPPHSGRSRPHSTQSLSRPGRRGENDDGSSTTSSRSRGHSPPPTPEQHRRSSLSSGRGKTPSLTRSQSADPAVEIVDGHYHSRVVMNDVPHAVALPPPGVAVAGLAPAPSGNPSPTSSVVSDGASLRLNPVVVNDAHVVEPQHLQYNAKLLAMYDDETASQSSQIIDRPIDDNVVFLSFPYTFDGVTQRVSFEYDLREDPAEIAAEFALEMGYPPEEMQPFAEFLACVRSRHLKGYYPPPPPPQMRSSFGSVGGPTAMESSDSLQLIETPTPDDSDGLSEDADQLVALPPAASAYSNISDDMLLDVDEDDDEEERKLIEDYKLAKMRVQSIHEDRMDKLQHSRQDCVQSHEQAAAKYEQDMRDFGRKEREISTSKEEAVSVHERNRKKYEKDMHDYEQKFIIEHRTFSKRLQEFDDDFRQKQDEVRRRARAKLSAPSTSRDQPPTPPPPATTYQESNSSNHNNGHQQQQPPPHLQAEPSRLSTRS